MPLTYEISMLPLLNIATILVLLTVFTTHMYIKTNIKTDLHLACSFGLISLLPFTLYKSTNTLSANVDFWSKSYHVAGLIVLLTTLAIYWLAEKRMLSERLPLIVITVIIAFTIVLPETLAGVAFALAFFVFAIWLYYQAAKGFKFELVRIVFYVLIPLTVLGGIIFTSNAFALLYSLFILGLLIYETLRYFDRIVSLLRNAGINSLTDSLTGLFNKGYLLKKVEQLVSHQEISIIFCDIDNFKKLNDMKGHDFGDSVLVNTGKAMKEVIGNNGFVCRYGGEEIVSIVVSGDAVRFAEQLRERVEKEVKITVSVGVASSKELQGQGLERLGLRTIKKADERMYKAKTSGKNKVVSNVEDNLDK